jgi:hypothetical protein
MHSILPLLLLTFVSTDLDERQQRQVTGLASAAAPEIQAAALLRLVESAELNPKQRAELLEQAFQAASQAHEPYPLTRVYGTAPDTADSYRAAASAALHLDRLSLQTRAVKLADPQLAKDLFARIAPPKPGTIGCESGTVPDLQPYYEAATTAHADPATLIAMAESHLELAAVARLVDSEVLTEALAAKLQSSTPDSRAFAASWASLQAELIRIGSRFPSPSLTEGIRKYIVTNFNAPRCVDSGQVFQTGREVLAWFNTAGIRGDAPPLEESSFSSPKVSGRAKVEAYWESADNQALMQGIRDLRFSAQGLPFTEAERAAPEWKQSLNEFLRKLRAARPDFQQTAALLQALIEFTPHGPERDRLIASFLDALRTSDLQRQAPQEWLWRADSLFRMLRQSADPDLEKLTAGFRNGGVPALVLYAWFHQNMSTSGMF